MWTAIEQANGSGKPKRAQLERANGHSISSATRLAATFEVGGLKMNFFLSDKLITLNGSRTPVIEKWMSTLGCTKCRKISLKWKYTVSSLASLPHASL